MLRAALLFLVVALVWLIPGHARAVIKEVDNMTGVAQIIQDLQTKKRLNPNQILVVFDVDDTLLHSPGYLGTDPWFSWQFGLIEKKTEPENRVANDLDGLVRVQEVLHAAADMDLSQEPEYTATFDLVAWLKQKKIPAMVLTARGPGDRDSTIRQLRLRELSFPYAPVCDKPLCKQRGYIPGTDVWAALRTIFSAENITKPRDQGGLGMSRDKIEEREIAYGNGITTVAGLNKGAMLRTLLKSWDGNPIRAIVFVDDTFTNVEKVNAAFEDVSPVSNIGVTAVHYTYYEDYKGRFDKETNKKYSPSVKSQTVAQWALIRAQLCAALGTFCEKQ